MVQSAAATRANLQQYAATLAVQTMAVVQLWQRRANSTAALTGMPDEQDGPVRSLLLLALQHKIQ